MGFGGGPKAAAPPIPPPAATPPTLASASAQSAGLNERDMAAGAGAINGINPTGPEGLQNSPSTAKQTLLGR